MLLLMRLSVLELRASAECDAGIFVVLRLRLEPLQTLVFDDGVDHSQTLLVFD